VVSDIKYSEKKGEADRLGRSVRDTSLLSIKRNIRVCSPAKLGSRSAQIGWRCSGSATHSKQPSCCSEASKRDMCRLYGTPWLRMCGLLVLGIAGAPTEENMTMCRYQVSSDIQAHQLRVKNSSIQTVPGGKVILTKNCIFRGVLFRKISEIELFHCTVPKLLIRKRYYVLLLLPIFIVQVTKLVQFT
jgi:hypothetical protein